MPSANIYAVSAYYPLLKEHLVALRVFLASILSTDERTLTPEEVSIRVFQMENGLPVEPCEVEIKAHAYPSRVARQDEICREISAFLGKCHARLEDNHVWLQLSELGHSWEE